MSPAIQLAQSVAWLGQMQQPMPGPAETRMIPLAFLFLLGLLAFGFLAGLLATIFGRWKVLAALLLCGAFGLVGMVLVAYLALPVRVEHAEVTSYYDASPQVADTNIAYGPAPKVSPAPPIELPPPASAGDSSATNATLVKAVGGALFDAFVKPAVDSAVDAGASKIIPPGRPEWVDQEPESRDGVDYVSISTGPYTSSTECYKVLKSLTNEAVQEQTARLLGSETKAARVPLDEQFIADHIYLQTYKESLDTTVGPMQQWHAHLQFNDQYRSEVERRWMQVQQSTRLTYAGALFAGVLAVLSILYGALSYNAATGGRHQARLQTVAGAAILGVVGGAILLTQWFPPV
ncbi:hypothetical protein LOC68_14850 [Blastopirellula sp. JC732]|uniref:Uncharacterized protein n=1 Tax=Blastopirellula sediminis TaxID=2894196 RepID=A0A9X1SKE5_9BACT|nr:hypothetical protein [Blastopirellula sediminis]MCC9607038.1 hypothetical protein [Blastopirellula sediminis]MCC9629669.1 hypothetical protein [Blastopirellula sediminis]